MMVKDESTRITKLEETQITKLEETKESEEAKKPRLVREDLEKMQFTMKNLIEVTKIALDQLNEIIDGSDVILTYGFTGCGKSTMINSLIFGSKALQK